MKLFKDGKVRSKKKNKLIHKYPTLTDGDFNIDDDDKLLNHLQQKLGKTKKEIRTIIEKL